MTESFELEITCRQVIAAVSNYLEGEVDASLSRRLEAHVGGCNHCRAVLDGVKNTITLFADERALELPSEVTRRLYEKLKQHLEKSQ